MKSVAVIGAGIFGSEISIKLASGGFEVTLFEANNDICMGSTPNSVMRLHLGFHYPRSLETAVQSRKGFISFVRRFPDCVDLSFNNFYAVAKEGSRTTTKDFKNFAVQAGIDMTEVSKHELSKFGVDIDRVDSSFLAAEGAISVDRVRNILRNDLESSNVSIRLDTEVDQANYELGFWSLRDSAGDKLGKFDFVVRSTYGFDDIVLLGATFPDRNYEYHRTLTLKIKSQEPRVGLTVIDGDFLTVLPAAFENSLLIYGPSPSVIGKWGGGSMPQRQANQNIEEINRAEKKVKERYLEWFPDNGEFEIQGRLLATRTIESGVELTDRRLSGFKLSAPSFIDVLSGKIDHCVDLAEEISREIQSIREARIKKEASWKG